MPEIAFVNDAFMPLSDAVVPIDDRGFVFSDGVYEVIAVYEGIPFRMREHLERIQRSAAGIRLPLPPEFERIEAWIEEGIRQSGFPDCKVYVQITRGVAPRGHAFPVDVQPTLVATFREKEVLASEIREQGVSLITIEDIRWARCDIKSVALLPNVLAKQQALDAGAFESVFYSDDKTVHECSVSNIFYVKRGAVITPAKSNKLLPGITRGVVLELTRELGIETSEKRVCFDDLFRADEIFLTGTTIEVLSVVKVDDAKIGDSKVGPVTRRIYERFCQEINTEPVAKV